MAEHLPLLKIGAMDEHERQVRSSEQVAQSDGQGTHLPSVSSLIVPLGQVVTHSPALAYSPGLAQEEQRVALV